jgi:hypothetical protein
MWLSTLRPTNGQARPYDDWYAMALLSKDILIRRFLLFPPLLGLLPVPLPSLTCSSKVYRKHLINPYFKYQP